MENKTHAEIIAEMRAEAGKFNRPSLIATVLNYFADRLEAAHKCDAASIERLVHDAIIDYQEMYPHAPNDEAERDLIDRANRGNAWLVSHGYEPEKTIWDKEEAPCL